MGKKAVLRVAPKERKAEDDLLDDNGGEGGFTPPQGGGGEGGGEGGEKEGEGGEGTEGGGEGTDGGESGSQPGGGGGTGKKEAKSIYDAALIDEIINGLVGDIISDEVGSTVAQPMVTAISVLSKRSAGIKNLPSGGKTFVSEATSNLTPDLAKIIANSADRVVTSTIQHDETRARVIDRIYDALGVPKEQRVPPPQKGSKGSDSGSDQGSGQQGQNQGQGQDQGGAQDQGGDQGQGQKDKGKEGDKKDDQGQGQGQGDDQKEQTGKGDEDKPDITKGPLPGQQLEDDGDDLSELPDDVKNILDNLHRAETNRGDITKDQPEKDDDGDDGKPDPVRDRALKDILDQARKKKEAQDGGSGGGQRTDPYDKFGKLNPAREAIGDALAMMGIPQVKPQFTVDWKKKLFKLVARASGWKVEFDEARPSQVLPKQFGSWVDSPAVKTVVFAIDSSASMHSNKTKYAVAYAEMNKIFAQSVRFFKDAQIHVYFWGDEKGRLDYRKMGKIDQKTGTRIQQMAANVPKTWTYISPFLTTAGARHKGVDLLAIFTDGEIFDSSEKLTRGKRWLYSVGRAGKLIWVIIPDSGSQPSAKAKEYMDGIDPLWRKRSVIVNTTTGKE